MTQLGLARARALIAVAFVVLGVFITGTLLARPEPFREKIMGLLFSLVLIALGAVRVRAYLQLRKTMR